MTEYETFMVYELDDSGEKIRLNVKENELKENLNPEQVLVIIREDLRRIFIWKGPKSPVRKRFISSRVAQAVQEEMVNDARYHRCKIVSVDAGDEPVEFLNAFQLESMEVTERLEDMRYVRNIERDRGIQATVTDTTPKSVKSSTKEEYFSPVLKDSRSDIIRSSYSPNVSSLGAKSAISKPISNKEMIGLSEEQKQKVKEKVLKNEVSEGYKRLNLILGHTLYAAVSKTAKVFGKDIEETEWEAVKKVPGKMIKLENNILRVYFNENQGIVEAVEVLQKVAVEDKKLPETEKITDFNSMTVKDLKIYAEEKKIDLPSNARKAEIIEILENFEKQNSGIRRNLPKIPSKDD